MNKNTPISRWGLEISRQLRSAKLPPRRHSCAGRNLRAVLFERPYVWAFMPHSLLFVVGAHLRGHDERVEVSFSAKRLL